MAQEYAKQFLNQEVTPQVTYKVVPVANPGTGNELTITVPAGKMWEVFCLNIGFTTSGVIADRLIKIVVKDGANEILITRPEITQNASLNITYIFTNVGTSSGVMSGSMRTVLPTLIVKTGAIIKTNTPGIDIGDLYSNSFFYVKETSITG